MDVTGGTFEYVPSVEEIPQVFVRRLPESFYTCRMFRWAVSHYPQDVRRRVSELLEEETPPCQGV